MDAIRSLLSTVPSGQVPDGMGIDRLLADCWDQLSGSSDGGMTGHKLIGRMENIQWNPLVLSFRIERHGGTVCGSTRAELQHWEVDLANFSARIVESGRRQLRPMAARADSKAMAAEIAQRIVDGEADDRISRLNDGGVKVLTSKLFPAGSGYKRTIEGRRKRLLEHVAEALAQSGWTRSEGSVFRVGYGKSGVSGHRGDDNHRRDGGN